MPAAERVFTCMILDDLADERFSARVTFVKKAVIRPSRYEKKITLADIFVQDVTGLLDRSVTITEDLIKRGASEMPSGGRLTHCCAN